MIDRIILELGSLELGNCLRNEKFFFVYFIHKKGACTMGRKVWGFPPIAIEGGRSGLNWLQLADRTDWSESFAK